MFVEWMSQPTSGTPRAAYRNLTLGATKQQVATAGHIQWIDVQTGASAGSLQVFDALAANVTVGTTAPTHTFAVGATTSTRIYFGQPLPFLSGITVAWTDTRTGSSNTGTVSVEIVYQPRG